MKRLSLFLLVLLCFGCSESEVDTFGGIAGTVADEITKEPLAGVKVSLTPGGTSQVTGTEGNFLFDNIDPQEYTLTFTKDDYVSQTQKVSVKAGTASNVQISMEPITPILNVMPKELDFGEETATLAIDITNAGKGTLQWNIDEDIAWLSCSPVSGTTNKESSPVVVTVSRTEMDRGDYNGMIVVTSNGGSQKIPVSMSVESVNLEIEPEELNFGSLTNSIQLTLKNTGSGTLKYTVESSNEWLVLNKESGSVTKTDYLEAIVTREGLSAGKYNATISFSVSGGNVVVPVKMEVAVNEKPTVSVENATDATYNSAVLHGTMVSVGSSKVTKYGFCWSEQPTPTLEDSYSNLGDCTAPTAFESVANDLKSDTKYYFRAYAENNVGIVYSEKELTFTTAGLPTLPSVTSGAVTEITSTTAVAKGNITSLGNVGKVTAYGHVWSKTAEPTLQTGKYTNLGEATETMAFSSEITGLESHTIYYIRAYATNEKGTAYGEENVFTTAKNDVRLTTSDVTEIVHNAATCGGVIADNGGHTIKERGVCWSTKSAPTVEDNYTVADNDKLSALVSRSIPSSVKTRTEYVTRAEDRFSCRITELAKETNYHVRAYVRTSDGNVFYGNEKQFTTTEEVALPSLTEITVSNIQTTSATVVSKIESDGNSAISECGFCYSKGAAPTVESGAKIACDPSSAELGKNITGLEEGTTYHIRAYAKNAMGVAYSKEAEFTTLAVTVPKLSPVVIENVGRTTAYASATVAETGNASITECGFCWATNPDPTIYDNKVPCEVGNSFKTKLQDLPLLTTVYVRAYAINSKGTGYSDDASFTTTDTDIDIWDGVSVATKFGGGMGTESDPIIINSADQLRLLLDRVSSGTTYSGVVFKMTTNIGLNNHAWSRSGTFAGTFDGNNMLLTGVTSSIFSAVSGTVMNIQISGTSQNAGICLTNTGTITNCVNNCFITSDSNNIAGICLSNSGKIESCTNKGKIQSTGYNVITGGIVATNSDNGIIDGCINYGSISGNGIVGGIVAESSKSASSGTFDCGRIQNCSNFGIISGDDAGGIIGSVELIYTGSNMAASSMRLTTSIANSFNCGDITGNNRGGICGRIKLYCCAHNNRYGNYFYFKTIVNVFNCINNSNCTICGHYSLDYPSGGYNFKDSDSGMFLSGTTYWLYDVANNIGQEYAIENDKSYDITHWYTRTTSGCFLQGNSTDIVSLLNSWVSSNSGTTTYKRWKYETIDGYACPVLE